MISVLFLATLVFSVGVKSLPQERQELSPIFKQTGDLSGYVGGDYESNNNWHLGGALHGDLKKPGIFDGGHIQGGYQFKNGVKLDGYLQGHQGGGFGGRIEGGYQFKNGVNLDGYFQGNTKDGVGGGLRVKIPLRKRSVSCATVCYEECKQDTDCLEQCVLTYC